jgi:hypothetical protein
MIFICDGVIIASNWLGCFVFFLKGLETSRVEDLVGHTAKVNENGFEFI